MFIDVTRRRNPELIDAAVALHRSGAVPSNSYVIDVDQVRANAATVSAAARSHGLVPYQMTKQFGRNPVVARAVQEAGIDGVVAVDFEEARLLHREGLRMGHLGHLVQVPAREVGLALSMAPDFITVFGFEQAHRISAVAQDLGRVQPLHLRVAAAGDTFYPAQRGGVAADDAVEVATRIEALPGVTVAGVTSFPVVLWSDEAGAFLPTQNLSTLGQVSAAINHAGLHAPVINAPSGCCSATFGMKAAAGATHVEPGSCLTGQTPLHAVNDEPELPAMIYVSEVSHVTRDGVYGIAGGLYPRCRSRTALINREAGAEPLVAAVELDPADAIDYYGTLHVEDQSKVRVGDTIVYAFRAQVFVSRCFVAVVRNVRSDPAVVGVFGRGGFGLTDDLLPVEYGRVSA